MEIERNVSSGNAWRDITHEAICDIFSSENEHHIHKRIQRFVKMASSGFVCRISKIFQGKHSKPLPEDLVLEIFSRLPAEDVLNCLMVCKRWMTVTLTPRFFDLHQTRAPPAILLQIYEDWSNHIKLYSLDLTHEKPCIRSFDSAKLLGRFSSFVGTCDGLLLFAHYSDSAVDSFYLSICNPLTGRVVTGMTVEANYCCGFWFHPFKKEYLFLAISNDWVRGYCYKIFNLKGESTILGWYETRPSYLPINISCSLYYLLMSPMAPQNCIMIFNIETERIDFKPHPHSYHCFQGHVGFSQPANSDMRLLEVEESVAFAHVCSDTNSLHLWMLVDRATWHWIEKYKINLNWDRDRLCHLNNIVYPLIVQKGEMLMLYGFHRLITFNLKTRRIRKIDISIVPTESGPALKLTTYKSSLVGLHRLADM